MCLCVCAPISIGLGVKNKGKYGAIKNPEAMFGVFDFLSGGALSGTVAVMFFAARLTAMGLSTIWSAALRLASAE